MTQFNITFYPDNKTVAVKKETTLLSAALSAGININSACGGDGVCGRCKVRVRKGTVSALPTAMLSLQEKHDNIYLACMTTVHSDTEVEILAESRLDFGRLSAEETAYRLKGLYSSAEEVSSAQLAPTELYAYAPLIEKLYLELPPPDSQDRISDLDRLFRQIQRHKNTESLHAPLAAIRRLGALLRDAQWKITVTLGRRYGGIEVVLVEPGDIAAKNYGFCFDIGTTTISGQLVDLGSKKVLGTKASYNKQAAFGSDVITRILHAKEPAGLEQLHDAVTDTMNEIIVALIAEHAVDLNNVNGVICAGNTTMIHLLLSIDPANIRREPYVPTANFIPVIKANEADIRINPHGLLWCMPGVASYVGADTVAGVLSSGLHREDELTMLIDIGTNGEIALGNKDFIAACAASAGPAFEGSGVSCGMRAGSAAIQKVRIDPAGLDVSYETIGNVKPAGICGSGYIHLLQQMLRAGIIDRGGRIKIDNHPRVRPGKTGKEFVVVFKDAAGSSADIVITEADIENLKRAKAAIYAAAEMLLKYMELDMRKIQKIYIAGGFGTYLDMESAIAIGLLPDIERSRFRFIGNSSLAGARQALLSQEAAQTARGIAQEMTYCELSAYPGYMDAYSAALFFPHTDLSKFPGIKI